MSKAVVYAVKCLACKGLRYLKRKPAGPYRCKRCAKTAPTTATVPTTPMVGRPRDPFYSDSVRRAELADRAKPKFLPSRPGWLQ